MTRKLFARSASIALCLGSTTPALAQDYRFAGYDGPQGINATINLRIPLGAPARASQPTFRLTLGFGRSIDTGSPDGREVVRQMRIGDLSFTGRGLRHARLVGIDLAALDDGTRLYSAGDNKSTFLLVAGVAGAAAAICLIAGCFDGDEDEDTSDPETPATPSNPG